MASNDCRRHIHTHTHAHIGGTEKAYRANIRNRSHKKRSHKNVTQKNLFKKSLSQTHLPWRRVRKMRRRKQSIADSLVTATTFATQKQQQQQQEQQKEQQQQQQEQQLSQQQQRSHSSSTAPQTNHQVGAGNRMSVFFSFCAEFCSASSTPTASPRIWAVTWFRIDFLFSLSEENLFQSCRPKTGTRLGCPTHQRKIKIKNQTHLHRAFAIIAIW